MLVPLSLNQRNRAGQGKGVSLSERAPACWQRGSGKFCHPRGIRQDGQNTGCNTWKTVLLISMPWCYPLQRQRQLRNLQDPVQNGSLRSLFKKQEEVGRLGGSGGQKAGRSYILSTELESFLPFFCGLALDFSCLFYLFCNVLSRIKKKS